jgi:tetratricopeptide (TPR) repeat protein
MKRAQLLSVVCSVSAACASTSEQRPARPEPSPVQFEADSPAHAPVAVEASALLAAPLDAEASSARDSSVPQLSHWSSPEFQRQFAYSYLAETEIEPRLTDVEREAMQSVLLLLSSEALEQAIARLQELTTPASSAVFDFTLGNLHFQRESWDDAQRQYDAAVLKHPKFRRAWKNLGLIHVRRAQWQLAAAALTRVLELGGGDATTFGLLAYAHANLEHHLAAESGYRMASLLEPATQDWSMGLARALFKQRRFADAAALCGELLVGAPDRADLWLLQANAYIGMGQPARAAENFELVDRLDASTADSLNSLGDIYVNDGLFAVAVDAYRRALERSPGAKPERALRAARVLASQGALDDAERLVTAIEASGGAHLDVAERKELLRLRARIAVAKDGGESEARILEEIVALDPLDGEALILLGQHASKLGEDAQAVIYFERAAAIEAFEADAKVRHAQHLVAQSKYASALALLRRAQELKPRENIQAYLEKVERASQQTR